MKSSCFNVFRNGKCGLFLSQKVDGNMIFTDYWKVFVLNFSEMRNTVFFESRNWWKDDIYWLLRSCCFELFGDRKYSLFFSQNVDGKMIFTWSFWAFYEIPGPGKYGFLRSVNTMFVSSGSLRRLNSCLNWKVEMPIHHVLLTKVYALFKNYTWWNCKKRWNYVPRTWRCTERFRTCTAPGKQSNSFIYLESFSATLMNWAY